MGEITVPSDLLCRQTQQLLPPKKQMARIANTDSLKITLAFASQVFMFPDVSHLSPSLLYHSDPALASAQTGSQTRHLYL